MNKDKTIKIGSRILSQNDLDILLPNNQNIYSQIDGIRSNAKALKEHLEKNKGFAQIVEEEPEFIKHHNNVFSIIGERGSGKTSVLLSIKNKIMKEIKDLSCEGIIKKNDTVLPIIVPQDMDEDSDSLGWIIGFFTKLVDDIEKEFQDNRGIFRYRNNNCNVCGNSGDTVKRQSVNYVKKAFEEVKKSYFLRKDHYKKSLVDVGSKKDYVNLNSETLSKDIQLAKCFKKFIDEYIEYKKHNASCVKNNEALIYIFFDDVDISTRKCLDVLETVIRFLSHSNIVVFVSGNYTTFEETIVLNYLYNDKLLDSKLIETNFTTQNIAEDTNALKIRKELAYDYLKKVLSPALRYELKKLTDKEKAAFKYSSEGQDEYKKLYELIKENFVLNGKNNFMEYESIHDGNDNFTIPMLFRAFDDKPRGLMNVYYYLNATRNQISNSNDVCKVWNTEELNRFLDIIIDSSSRLNIYKGNIKSVIKIIETEGEDRAVDVDVRYSEIINGTLRNRNIIEDNLKLDVLCLGMLFDGIGCAINGVDYKNNFIKTKEFNEVKEIQLFLNKELVGENQFGFDIIHKMLNPFEMLYVFSVAQKYQLRTSNRKDFVFAMTNILIELAVESSCDWEKETKIEKSKVEDVSLYTKSKVEYQEEWFEKLKELCRESSKLLSFDVENELKINLKNYFLIDKEGISKQNVDFFEKTEGEWNDIKGSIHELELIDSSEFNEYFDIRTREKNLKDFELKKIQSWIDDMYVVVNKIKDLLSVIFDMEFGSFEEEENIDERNTLKNIVGEINLTLEGLKSRVKKDVIINPITDETIDEIEELFIEYIVDAEQYGGYIKAELDDISDKLKNKDITSIIEQNLEEWKENDDDYDVIQKIIVCILLRIEFYHNEFREYSIVMELVSKIEPVIENRKEQIGYICSYLGFSTENFVFYFTDTQNKLERYNYHCIDQYYFFNTMMTLFKQNNMSDIELSKSDTSRLNRALKYKDDELVETNILLKLTREAVEYLEEIKENPKYKKYRWDLGEGIDRNLIYWKCLKEISDDLEHEKKTRMGKSSFENFLEEKDIYMTEGFEIRNEIHFRSYALLYAIIVKETSEKDIYEEKEQFYIEMLKSLGDYDNELRDSAFKLLY